MLKQDSVVKVKYFLIFIGEKCIFNLSLILHYKSKIVKTISGYGKFIDGPIFSHSRWEANLGEFEMKFPRI